MKILIVDSPGSLAGESAAAMLLALNAAELSESCELVALNFELPADGSVPDWLDLIPAGPVAQGRDGRSWLNDNPQAILDAFVANALDIPIDWEHATELKARKGDPAPAAGWIKELQLRDGVVAGRIEWTPRGRASVESREYRYLSPAINIEKGTNFIRSISSVGLVNKPNFRLPALNHAQKEHPMDLKDLLLKLGLPENGTLEQALNAIGKMQGDLQVALNRAETPSLELFVPRGDYDTALNRAATAETKLADQQKVELETAINSEVDAAMQAGKIIPATKDYYLAMCRQDGGLEQFKKFVAAAPVVGDASGLDTKQPKDEGVALNSEEKQICANLGISEEEYRKAGN